MRKFKWLIRMIAISLKNRGLDALIALFSLILASGVVVSMYSLSGAESHLRTELSAYGADMVVFPEGRNLEIGFGRVPLESLKKPEFLSHIEIEKGLKRVEDYIRQSTPVLERKMKAGGEALIFKGLRREDFKKYVNAWDIEGKVPEKKRELFIGGDLSESLEKGIGDKMTVAGKSYKITGTFNSGTPEDDKVFLPMRHLQKLFDMDRLYSQVLLRIDSKDLSRTTLKRKIEKAIHGGQVKIKKRTAKTREGILGKIRFLFGLVTVFILFASFISVVGTMSSMALKRRGEVALFRALGGPGFEIAKFFLGEIAFLGIAGGVLGAIGGGVVYEAVTYSAFQKEAVISPWIVPLGIGVGVCVALISSLPAFQVILKVNPVKVLRENN